MNSKQWEVYARLGPPANIRKHAGTNYYSIIAVMGGRATRGISKRRGVNKETQRREQRRNVAPLKRSGLENATMQEILAELDA